MKPTVQAFLTEPRIATFTTIRADGTPHVAPARLTWDDPASTARRYHRRYRCAPPDPAGRVVIEIAVDRILTLDL
ncbi:pyridoxamine 5'-phosphate oxidase family protein [Nocardia sp. NPDC002869]|uniref:pyridoxamine 5'-phosphate oxidase family protein n=1 Tax=Nocardia sp. NPDC002869 TaxID=3161032 RepID=UPI00398CC441